MNITLATKNISETHSGFGVIIALHGAEEKYLASFEEDEKHNLRLDTPIKVMHQVGETKTRLCSFQEFNVTNELIKALDKVIDMFDNAPIETKRVLAF